MSGSVGCTLSLSQHQPHFWLSSIVRHHRVWGGVDDASSPIVRFTILTGLNLKTLCEMSFPRQAHTYSLARRHRRLSAYTRQHTFPHKSSCMVVQSGEHTRRAFLDACLAAAHAIPPNRYGCVSDEVLDDPFCRRLLTKRPSASESFTVYVPLVQLHWRRSTHLCVCVA